MSLQAQSSTRRPTSRRGSLAERGSSVERGVSARVRHALHLKPHRLIVPDDAQSQGARIVLMDGSHARADFSAAAFDPIEHGYEH